PISGLDEGYGHFYIKLCGTEGFGVERKSSGSPRKGTPVFRESHMVDSVSNKSLLGDDVVRAWGNLIQFKTYFADARSNHRSARADLDFLRRLLRDRDSRQSERASGNAY